MGSGGGVGSGSDFPSLRRGFDSWRVNFSLAARREAFSLFSCSGQGGWEKGRERGKELGAEARREWGKGKGGSGGGRARWGRGKGRQAGEAEGLPGGGRGEAEREGEREIEHKAGGAKLSYFPPVKLGTAAYTF